MNDRRRLASGRKKIAPLIVAAALIALIAMWWHAISRVPVIVVPSPKMPAPNAHDDYIAAYNVLVDSNKIGYAISRQHASGGDLDDHPYTLAQQEALVVENAAAFKLIRKALSETYWAPPARSFDALFPYYAHFRSLARLLLLEEMVKAGRGDWNGAINSGLDCIQMGKQVPHGAVIIGLLVGIACEAIGRRNLWDAIDHLDAAQARAAAKRLEGILADSSTYADTLQEEIWFTQAGLKQIFSKPGWQKQLLSSYGSAQDGAQSPFSTEGLKSLQFGFMLAMRGGPRVVLLNYTTYMNRLRDRARLPYATRPPVPSVPDDPINQMIAPTFTQVEYKDAYDQTENNLLLVALALRAYYAERNHYPQTPGELAPGYIRQIPRDLFSASGALSYRVKGKKYLLYSVGPDGVDDGGKPGLNTLSFTSQSSSFTRYMMQENSKGDIVAGINR